MAAEKERKKGAEIQRQTGEEEGARKTDTNSRHERKRVEEEEKLFATRPQRVSLLLVPLIQDGSKCTSSKNHDFPLYLHVHLIIQSIS